MPTFETPKPVTVDINLLVGGVTIEATDRIDTVVTVAPTDPANESDVAAAAETRVERSNDTVAIRGPSSRKYVGRNKGGSLAVTIAVPTGSHVSGGRVGSILSLTATGRLGTCRFRSGMGDVSVDQAGPVKLRVFGDVEVNEVAGNAELSTSGGKIRLGQASGDLDAKNSTGPCVIGTVAGTAKVRCANGDITIDTAAGNINAGTAQGSIRIDEVVGGDVEVKSSMGPIEIGLAEGIAAWFDARSGFGTVHNRLTDAQQPEPGETTVKVRARTSYGDITIRRSSPDTACLGTGTDFRQKHR